MNPFGKTLSCLAVAVVLGAGVLPSIATPLDNPYMPIVTRNVFNLNPSISVDSPVPTDPLPIITPNGITSILGSVQVLFKTANSNPGQSAREKNYILGEGQLADGISVIRIDEKNAIITFDNHGATQEIRLLAVTVASGFPAATGSGGQTIFPNLGGLPDGSHFHGASPLTSGNRMIGNDGTIPNPPGFGAGGYAGRSHNKPSDQGLNASAGGNLDNQDVSMQDSSFSNRGGSDPNNISNQSPKVSAAEHLANLQMIMFAKQRMQ
jgi:hypothetical protein